VVAHRNDVLIHRLQAKVDKLQDELTTTKVSLAVANARIGTKEKRDRWEGRLVSAQKRMKPIRW